MKKLYMFLVAILVTSLSFGQDMIITGLFDGPLPGGVPKVAEIYVINNIADLSIYGLGSANNGGGSDGEEFTFPADTASAGEFIYVAKEDAGGEFNAYFGFQPNYIESSAVNFNGDDAVELFMGGNVIDTFGDINVDGTGEPWEYLDGWAYRNDNTGPDGTTFLISNWYFSGVDANDGQTTNATAPTPFPLGTFSYVPTSDPTLAIASPGNGTIFNPEITAVDVTFSVQNFVVANTGGDGYIKYTIDAGSPTSYYTTDPIPLTGLSSGSHTFYMELVDNAGNVLSPEVNDQVTFEIATYTDVADLAGLRAGTIGEYYRVTGEVIGTFAQAYRNQKWAQDASAGILIDDEDGIITTTYDEGDGITNLRGKLGSFYDVLQILPTADPGAASSTGNVITPELITLADLVGAKALPEYESELVQILGVTITDITGGDGTFQVSENYDIADGTDVSFLRTAFPAADYIGQALPGAPVDMVCLVGGFNGTPQVTPRDFFDFLDVDQQETIAGFSLYPNPVRNGAIQIMTQNNLEKSIQIFDVLGKEVFTKTMTNSTLDITTLRSGVYIIKVVEADRFETRKLVVE